MAITKPLMSELNIWARNAASGDKAKPSQTKINDGFAYTEKPPHWNFNWFMEMVSQYIAYVNEKGIAEWDGTSQYRIGSVVQVAGVLWVAIADSVGSAPSLASAHWRQFTSDLGIRSLPVNDATPSVKWYRSWKTANTSLTTITGFDDGAEGQIITIRCADPFTTISNTLTASGMTIPLLVGDVLEFTFDGSNWIQSGGSVGMGSVFVPVAPTTIGDWIGATITAYTAVDLSDDGVRKGASSCYLSARLTATSGNVTPGLNIAGTLTGSNATVLYTLNQINYEKAVVIPDNNAKVYAKFSSDWAAKVSSNNCIVSGYWI